MPVSNSLTLYEGMRRTWKYAAVTKLERNTADGLFEKPSNLNLEAMKVKHIVRTAHGENYETRYGCGQGLS
jgi:hypothetical protein